MLNLVARVPTESKIKLNRNEILSNPNQRALKRPKVIKEEISSYLA